jgi:hypothetical protein
MILGTHECDTSGRLATRRMFLLVIMPSSDIDQALVELSQDYSRRPANVERPMSSICLWFYYRGPSRANILLLTSVDVSHSIIGYQQGLCFCLECDHHRASHIRNQDHVHLIKFFASLAVASDIELGWDTTIRRVSTKNDGIQYQIQVGQNWYQTCGKPLHDFRANNIVGRGTRVYKVHPMKLVDNQLVVADNTITYVLKDVWMERDEKQEAIKIKRIRHALKQWRLAYPDAPDAANFTYDPAFDKDYKIEPTWFEAPGDNPHAFDDDAPPQFAGHTWGSDPWDKYFPLVRDHGNVKVGLEGKVDSFRNMMKDNGFDMLYKQVVLRSRDNSSLPVDEESRMDSFGVARLRDAIHYREVFEHVGVRLDEVSSLSDVCEGLRDAAIGKPIITVCNTIFAFLTHIQGLRWLFRIGWMHRDLSMGNILTVTIVINGMPVNVAQLTDFEYSQPIHDQDEDEYQQTV